MRLLALGVHELVFLLAAIQLSLLAAPIVFLDLGHLRLPKAEAALPLEIVRHGVYFAPDQWGIVGGLVQGPTALMNRHGPCEGAQPEDQEQRPRTTPPGHVRA